MTDAARTAVTLQGVEKRFGDVVAVAGVELDAYDGEFFLMLGPPGSGKTTTLRMIAGFERLPPAAFCSTAATLLSVIPVYIATRLTSDTTTGGRA